MSVFLFSQVEYVLTELPCVMLVSFSLVALSNTLILQHMV